MYCVSTYCDLFINPFPAPGHRVGAVHGRRDTRTAAGGAPEPARYPPMASRDPLNVRNNFHTKKKITHTRNFRAQRFRLQELRYAGLDTSIRLTTRPLRPMASSFWPSRANLMTMAGTKKIGASPIRCLSGQPELLPSTSSMKSATRR